MKSYETVLKNNFFIFNLLDLLLLLHVLMYVYILCIICIFGVIIYDD